MAMNHQVNGGGHININRCDMLNIFFAFTKVKSARQTVKNPLLRGQNFDGN